MAEGNLPTTADPAETFRAWNRLDEQRENLVRSLRMHGCFLSSCSFAAAVHGYRKET